MAAYEAISALDVGDVVKTAVSPWAVVPSCWWCTGLGGAAALAHDDIPVNAKLIYSQCL